MSGHDERELFRRHMADVVRQQTDVVPPDRPRPAPIPRQTRKDERAVIEDLADETMDWAEHQNGDELFYYQPGVQRRTMRKLRRGGYSVTAELDLHGCTVQQARGRLSEFLGALDRRHQTCVRIIHGKGHGSPGRQPVLRNKVALWLARRLDVLGYCSAPGHDGGLGAIYVLLRRL